GLKEENDRRHAGQRRVHVRDERQAELKKAEKEGVMLVVARCKDMTPQCHFETAWESCEKVG
ncbi:hypothetical protein LTS18_004136, partial [Coniosporium uncinatum]